MVRWAKRSDGSQKKPHEASSWSELSSKQRTASTDGNSMRILKSDRPTFKRRPTKQKYSYSEGSWHKQSEHNNPDFDSELDVSPSTHFTNDKPKGLAAELEELKNSAVLSTEAEQEISSIIKKDKKREARRQKRVTQRQTETICFHCREAGHDMAECPSVKTSNEQGTGICFKCGSTEHKLNQCKVKLPDGHYPYAKCFICGEQGHLSKQCPDNPRGLYPNGGCCNLCGSVEHYKKDCPDLQKQQGINDIRLTTIGAASCSMDAEVVNEEKTIIIRKKGPKIVKF